MESLKFKNTVYLVFLIVSLCINALVIYMLIEEPKEEEVTIPQIVTQDNRENLVSTAMQVYKGAYDIINNEDSGFYIIEHTAPNKKCPIVSTGMLNNYFSSKAIVDLVGNISYVDGNYYDCDGSLKEALSDGLFGNVYKTVRDLEYIASNDDTLIVKGQLVDNDTVIGDNYPLYMILRYENGKWLIDLFE